MTANQAGYEVTSYTDTYQIFELKEHATNSRVLICPERGGIVIGCQLQGQELLYLDRDTFIDPAANIRGGIPVLFPICGQVRNGAYEWDGVRYNMRNHGVARQASWNVEGQSAENGASLTLSLESSAQTQAAYPFNFKLTFTYRLKDGKLDIEQAYSNLSETSMPVHAGFHPYFAIAEKNLTYRSDAQQALDYNDNQVKPFSGPLDLNGLVESVALLDATTPEISFPFGDQQIKLSYSEVFGTTVIWSVEGKPFVCVEPWTAPNEALNDKKGLVMVEPGKALEASITIALEA
ncbi:aldose epimerase [Paenibacillus sp. FSL H8-0537]|uniref:aldose epimerase family protein n=1 Tax=Paenibacillus sp. FSL H8-0537 TaxID=2921399 RepID=UPI003100CC8F